MTMRYGSRVLAAMVMVGAGAVGLGQGRPLSAVEMQERGLLPGQQQGAAPAASDSKMQDSVPTQDGAKTAGTAEATGPANLSAAKESVVQQDTVTAMQPGDSHVRIVRLSEMRGEVRMDRKTGNGYEQTMQNMPIVEGMKLETKAGTAEVEFEDGSTLRAAPDTVIAFPQLVRRAGGETASTVVLVQGMMYVTLTGTKNSVFTVKTGTHEMTVAPGTHLRLEMSGPKVMVAVFKGSAEVPTADGLKVVEKKQTLTLGGDADGIELAKNVAKGPLDAWDKQANDYHEQNMRGNALLASGGGSAFGVSDLNYYGNFTNVAGCGQVWQPYFTSAAWSPYAAGAWAYYPGAGYSFVSPYPWGWLPYHSGQWVQCGGAGWGWRPGGSFVGINNIAGGGYGGGSGSIPGLAGATGQPQRLTNGPIRSPGLPGVPAPPRPGSASLVMATRGPVTASGLANDGFVFQNNSAGLGVPRGELGKLNHISNDVQRHGTMAMPVEGQSMMRGNGANGASGPRGEFARSQMNLRPAGSPEVRGAGDGMRNGGMGRTGNPGNGGNAAGSVGPYRGGNDGVRGSGGQGAGGGNAPQRSGPPPSPGSGGFGGGGRGGGMGGGGMGGGGGAVHTPPPPSAAPSGGAAPGPHR